MYKYLLILLLSSFFLGCSSMKEVVNESVAVPRVLKQKTVIDRKSTFELPLEKAIATFEDDESIEFKIIHAYGNPDTRELTIEYRMKNWGPRKYFVVNAEGNTATINGKIHAVNCAYINGMDYCSDFSTTNLNAKTDAEWHGKLVFQNVQEFESKSIDKLVMQYKLKQLKGTKKFAEFENVPIVWNSSYKESLAKKIPERLADDNDGLFMQIDRAVLDEATREMKVIYTMINLDGRDRNFNVNARSNEMIFNGKTHRQSCAGIGGEMECGLHFVEKWRLDPGESVSGEYIFKNVKASEAKNIPKLVLRYNETVLLAKPYYAIFTKIPVEVQ